MRPVLKLSLVMLLGAVALGLGSCKKSSSTATSAAGGNTIAGAASNVVTISVSAGPNPQSVINTLYTTVTVCAPGSTTNCQTISNIQVDTGASGLRLFSSVLQPSVAAALPLMVDGSGNNIVECAEYADGYAWGPVATADLTVSGESAPSLPIQIIGSAQFPTVPVACFGKGKSLDSVAAFGANGTIGIATLRQDCGSSCDFSLDPAINPGFYYACTPGGTCNVTTVPLGGPGTSGPQQVQNPVTYFTTDNDGVIIELPSVAATGASTATGALVFGIDTQTNNATNLGLPVITLAAGTGLVSTTLNQISYPDGFFDTGSNGLYFQYSGLAACTGSIAEFYCPTATTGFTATVASSTNTLINIAFSVANAQSLENAGGSELAFSNLAGTTASASTFDWGLPFFYGRNVYLAIEGKSTSAGVGPYASF